MIVRTVRVASLAALGSVAIVVACAGPEGTDEPELLEPDATPDFGDGANDGWIPLDAAAPDVECKMSCSADLHDWIDCTGQSKLHCPSDKACLDGACVDPCLAAEGNKSTYGCEYYSVDPAEFNEKVGSCFAAYVVNTWNEDVTLEVEYKGAPLNVADFARVPKGTGTSITYEPLPEGKLPPNQVAILFLAEFPNPQAIPCPAGITAAVTEYNVKLKGTGITDGFLIKANRPVVAFDIYPYGGGGSAATSATLLIPTSAWGTNYVAQAGYKGAPSNNIETSKQPFIQIAAKEDGTVIRLARQDNSIPLDAGPSPDTDAGALSDAATLVDAGVEAYTLNKGQVLQLSQPVELTGTAIESLDNKPIGVWGGHNCLNIEPSDYACDTAHQQISPMSAMGHEYVAVRYRDRVWFKEENPPWRLVGLRDDTKLTYEPFKPKNAPDTLKLGQIAEFKASDPFIVRSQDKDHPFYMSAHMTGGEKFLGIGDPEWVNVIPPGQWLSRYVFFTDPTYPETSLVVIRAKLGDQLEDVFLDCLGPISDWWPIDTKSDYEYARVDLVTGKFQGVGGCDNGVHTMFSKGPFTVTVWGWGNSETEKTTYVSYAYPAGAGVRGLTAVRAPVGGPN